jgi:site-specific DNA recombinase
MSAAQISELVGELGGLSAVLGAATGAERAHVYASLALRLDYDPYLRRVRATADLSRVAGCVRGGTCPPATRVTEFAVGCGQLG